MRAISRGSISIALVIAASLTCSAAHAKKSFFFIPLFFGESSDISFLSQTNIPNKRGNLALGYLSTNYYFFAGVWHHNEYVLYEKEAPGKTVYMPLSSADIKDFQTSKHLPTPLPSYSIPFWDYVAGFSLWIMLGLTGGGFALAGLIANRPRRETRQSLSAGDAGALYQQCLKGVLVTMMLSGGEPTPEHRGTVREVYNRLFSEMLSDAELDSEIDRCRRQHAALSSSLARIAPLLTDNGKETVLRSALQVAVAVSGEPLGTRQLECFGQIATALQMTTEHVKRVMIAATPPLPEENTSPA